MTEIDRSNPDSLSAASLTDSPSLCDYYARSLENVRQRLPQVAGELVAASVVRVHVLYDGYGDSGQIEVIEYSSSDGAPLDLTDKVSLSEEALTDLFYDLTQVRHPGWETEDGACGDFVWDLTAGTLHHTHNDRYTGYETTEHEGL